MPDENESPPTPSYGYRDEVSKDILGGKTEKLKDYLEKNNLETILKSFNTNDGSPLHDACQCEYLGAATEMVTHLLAWHRSKQPEAEAEGDLLPMHTIFINKEDKYGNTALHYAAKKKNWQAAKALILFGANPHTRNEKGVETITLLYKYVPQSVVALLKTKSDFNFLWDKTWKKSDDVKFFCNFSNIIGVHQEKECPQNAGESQNQTDRPNQLIATSEVIIDVNEQRQNDTRIEMVELGGARAVSHGKSQQNEMFNLCNAVFYEKSIQKEILDQPIIKLFIDLKWNNLKKPIIASIVANSLWSILCMVSIMYASHLNYENAKGGNPPSKIRNTPDMELRILLFMCAILTIIKEIVIYSFWTPAPRKMYYLQPENVANYLLASFLICFFSNLIPLQPWQYKVVSMGGIIAAFVILWSQVNKFPPFGIYSDLFKKVLIRFGFFSAYICPIVILWACLFRLIMPEVEKPQLQLWPPFGFVKVVAMMAGEIDFDELIEHVQDETLGTVLSKTFLLLIFVAIVTLLLHNLFIGLVVDELKKLEKRAETKRRSKTVRQLYLMEAFILTVGKILSYLCRCGTWLENWPKIQEKRTNGVTRKMKDFSPKIQNEILKPLFKSDLEKNIEKLKEKLKNKYVGNINSPEVT